MLLIMRAHHLHSFSTTPILSFELKFPNTPNPRVTKTKILTHDEKKVIEMMEVKVTELIFSTNLATYVQYSNFFVPISSSNTLVRHESHIFQVDR